MTDSDQTAVAIVIPNVKLYSRSHNKLTTSVEHTVLLKSYACFDKDNFKYYFTDIMLTTYFVLGNVMSKISVITRH